MFIFYIFNQIILYYSPMIFTNLYAADYLELVIHRTDNYPSIHELFQALVMFSDNYIRLRTELYLRGSVTCWLPQTNDKSPVLMVVTKLEIRTTHTHTHTYRGKTINLTKQVFILHDTTTRCLVDNFVGWPHVTWITEALQCCCCRVISRAKVIPSCERGF